MKVNREKAISRLLGFKIRMLCHRRSSASDLSRHITSMYV